MYSDSMPNSLYYFLKGIIDYAGLFPPASLSFEETVQNFSQYLRSDSKWMLANIIIPVSKLRMLDQYADNEISSRHPFPISVLAPGCDTIEEFQNLTDHVLGEISRLNHSLTDLIHTTSFEVKLPLEVVEAADPELVEELLNETTIRFEQRYKAPCKLFYELSAGSNIESYSEPVFQALAAQNEIIKEENFEQTHFTGFKLRTGGVNSEDFPSAETVALVIRLARKYKVPLKFTAGLHHPVRHFNESVQTKMHGFFNVFAAGMLSYTHDFDLHQVKEVLLEEDPAVFRFDDDGFAFHDYRIGNKEIEELRSSVLISFGSCSFDEPLDDLKQLGLI